MQYLPLRTLAGIGAISITPGPAYTHACNSVCVCISMCVRVCLCVRCRSVRAHVPVRLLISFESGLRETITPLPPVIVTSMPK